MLLWRSVLWELFSLCKDGGLLSWGAFEGEMGWLVYSSVLVKLLAYKDWGIFRWGYLMKIESGHGF